MDTIYRICSVSRFSNVSENAFFGRIWLSPPDPHINVGSNAGHNLRFQRSWKRDCPRNIDVGVKGGWNTAESGDLEQIKKADHDDILSIVYRHM